MWLDLWLGEQLALLAKQYLDLELLGKSTCIRVSAAVRGQGGKMGCQGGWVAAWLGGQVVARLTKVPVVRGFWGPRGVAGWLGC